MRTSHLKTTLNFSIWLTRFPLQLEYLRYIPSDSRCLLVPFYTPVRSASVLSPQPRGVFWSLPLIFPPSMCPTFFSSLIPVSYLTVPILVFPPFLPPFTKSMLELLLIFFFFYRRCCSVTRLISSGRCDPPSSLEVVLSQVSGRGTRLLNALTLRPSATDPPFFKPQDIFSPPTL